MDTFFNYLQVTLLVLAGSCLTVSQALLPLSEIEIQESKPQPNSLLDDDSNSNTYSYSRNSNDLDRALTIMVNNNGNKLKIGVLGAPFGGGQPKPGVENGPAFCRATEFIPILQTEANQDIVDYGDISFEPQASKTPVLTGSTKNVKAVGEAAKEVSDKIKSNLAKDPSRIPLTLGGDHSIAIGTIDAISSVHSDVGVLYVDAHGDINTPTTTLTGNMHGMPLAFILKELEPNVTKFPEFSWLKPRISVSNLAYIGTRSLDPDEKITIKQLNITTFTMDKIRRLGIRKVTQLAIKKITDNGKRPFHLSFDIDVMDPTEIMITGVTAPGGLKLHEGISLMKEVHSSGQMISMDFVEVNPSLGSLKDQLKGAYIIRKLLLNVFGFNERTIKSS